MLKFEDRWLELEREEDVFLNREDCFLNVVSSPVAKGTAGWPVRPVGNGHAQVFRFLPCPADDAVRLAQLPALRDGEERAPATHEGRLRGQHVR